jgi:hypothetical protein
MCPWLSAYLRVVYRAGMNNQPPARVCFEFAQYQRRVRRRLYVGCAVTGITADRHRLKVRPGRALE